MQEILNTPVEGSFDVIVAGGGPAGVGAAIAAARRGMRTLLIEKYGFLGGNWTAGLVNPLFSYENKGGILKELIGLLQEAGCWGGFNNACFRYEEMKYLLDRMIQDAGVTPLYHSWVSRCICRENRVTGVVVENRGGRAAYEAKCVIDCTGDGNAAVTAGAQFLLGREQDKKTQPMTLMFVLGNVHFGQQSRHHLQRLLQEAVNKYHLDYQVPYLYPWIIPLPDGDRAVVQLTHHRNLCSMSAFDLTTAEIEGRQQVRDTVHVMQNYVEELKGVELLYTATEVGVRESRRIIGEYILDKDDLMRGAKFEDGIAATSYNIDIHNPDNTDHVLIKTQEYEIPYRCLIPKGKESILTAGRCISGTHEALASYRVTGNCVAM